AIHTEGATECTQGARWTRACLHSSGREQCSDSSDVPVRRPFAQPACIRRASPCQAEKSNPKPGGRALHRLCSRLHATDARWASGCDAIARDLTPAARASCMNVCASSLDIVGLAPPRNSSPLGVFARNIVSCLPTSRQLALCPRHYADHCKET